jgi:deoxyribodipyrimidine photo-lyase
VLEPTKPDWAGDLRETWKPGEATAQAQLKAFLDHGVLSYTDNRDHPDRPVVAQKERKTKSRR